MFQGQYLFTGDAFYSPWMRKGGDNVFVTVNRIKAKGSADLKVELVTKSSETEGDGAPLAGDITIQDTAASGGDYTLSKLWEGVNELVRYKFSALNGATGDYVVFRVLSPSWFDEIEL